MKVNKPRIFSLIAVIMAAVIYYNFGLTPVYGLIDRAVDATNYMVALCTPESDNYNIIDTEPLRGDTTESGTEATQQAEDEAVQSAASPGSVLGSITRRSISGGSLIYDKISLNNKSSAEINIKKSLAQKIDLSVGGSDPQVLIYHTHATESYISEERDYYTDADAARNTDNTKNVTAVGEKVAAGLKSGGVEVVHDTTQHDYPAYSGSYKRSAQTIKSVLEANPTVQMMIDIHRDSIPDENGGKTAAVCEINGKQAAQVMIIVSAGYEGYEQNLALALKLHQTLEVLYPGFARPMIVYDSVYNQDKAPFCLLIEVGTDANSMEEALYAGEILGQALSSFLNDYK